jgi:hypothetical protein
VLVPDVRGFNYSGSWGTSGLDLWQHHDHGTMAVEVARGKRFFPGWNVARWWLSHESFQRDRVRFLANLEAGVTLFAEHDILVLPVLFNRWRDPLCDFGGVSIDHFMAGASNHIHPMEFAEVRRAGAVPSSIDTLFGDYVEAVVGSHADDPRILAWDLCNEPLMGPYVTDPSSPIRVAELRWLTWLRASALAAGAQQPITIGNYANLTATRLTEPLSDVISFHPYFMPAMFRGGPVPVAPDLRTREGFTAYLEEIVELGRATGKAVLASETVWGANEDAEHVELIDQTLAMLTERNIGFVVHALNHSLVADLHAEAYGPVGPPGRLEFINADGSLREGHEIFNRFA